MVKVGVMNFGGKIKDVRLNNHIVSVITPKNPVSYEEGMKRIDKLISEIKEKNRGIRAAS